jgi:iron complex outermembrane receptor protein
MKRVCMLVVLASFLPTFMNPAMAQSLSGIVIDSISHQPIPEAIVYLPQLKSGGSTDAKGNYKISSLPSGTYVLEVQYIGYATITRQISLKGDLNLNFAMVVSTSSMKEVVITALGNLTNTQHSPIPVTIISHDLIQSESSTNVIDAIAMQPGLSEITEGPGISKPEINGLGYNRVLTLLDGERQEDFQWGDEHGILIDPYAVYDAEVIRGPASLQYGANAVAGVVSFKSEPYAESGTIAGSVLTEYQTNNGMIGNSIDIGGNNKGFIWNFRMSQEEAHCYRDPKDGYVWGTAYNQQNARATFGINKKWGYSRLSFSALHRQIEVPDGNRDSATGKFEFDAPQNAVYAANGTLISGQVYPNRANFLSYYTNISQDQVLDHYAAWWQNSMNAGKGEVQADIGFTMSVRSEIDTGLIAAETITVHDIPYSLKYQVAGDSSGLKFTTGVNGMYEFENSTSEPPYPYIGNWEIPNYSLFDIGGYGILQKDYKKLTLSGGLRYDMRSITGQSMYLSNYNTHEQQQAGPESPGAYKLFNGFNNVYTGLSASLGATYQLPENKYVKINLAKSYRAPSIQELSSNAMNGGENAFILGNNNLKAEQGYQVDIAYGSNGKDISFEADGFCNYISNFIFEERIPSKIKNRGDSLMPYDGINYPVLSYLSSNAIISGVAAYFNIHPADTKWIEIDNGFTYIYSYIPHASDSTNHVPLTPAPRLTSEVKFKLGSKTGSILKGTYLEIGLAKYWAQNNIYSELYTELPSLAYTLYNAGVGTNFVNPKTSRVICSFYLNVTNLANIAYVDHLSHVQYFRAYNEGIPAVVTQQSEGIYNMGRNIGFKLVFPIGGHKISEAEKGIKEY